MVICVIFELLVTRLRKVIVVKLKNNSICDKGDYLGNINLLVYS